MLMRKKVFSNITEYGDEANPFLAAYILNR